MSLFISEEFKPITRHEEHYCPFINETIIKRFVGYDNRISFVNFSLGLRTKYKIKLAPTRLRALINRERSKGRLKNVISHNGDLWVENDMHRLDEYKQVLLYRSKQMLKIANAFDLDAPKYNPANVVNNYTKRKDLH